MKAIILAAGNSSRLGGITKKIPKGLLKINGKSIIQRQIEIYEKNGIKDIIIITGPNSEKFDIKDVTYIHDDNYKNHDVLGSLMVGKKFMKNGFIMSYSDIIYDEKILKKIIEFKGKIGIAVDLDWEKKYVGRSEHPKSQADNVLIENVKIKKIKKNILKCDKFQKMGEFVGLMKISNIGTEIFVEKFNELLESHQGKFQDASSIKKAYLTDLIQELIDSNIQIDPIEISGNWYEIDTPQDLEKVKKILSN